MPHGKPHSFLLRSIFKYSLCQYPVIDMQVPVPYFNKEAREEK